MFQRKMAKYAHTRYKLYDKRWLDAYSMSQASRNHTLLLLAPWLLPCRGGVAETECRAHLKQQSPGAATSLIRRRAHVLDDELQGRPPAESVSIDREGDVPRRIG